MNEYSKELCHWAFGKKAKDHKYIAREDGKQKGKYIYFYDISKWKDWKNKAVEATKKAASGFASNWKEGAGMLKSSAKEYGKLWRQGAGIKTKQEKRMEPKYDKPAGPKQYTVGPTQRMPNNAQINVPDAVKKPVERKYIAKMKTKDGKTRYFYSQKELDNWVRKQQYQVNEPDFMKKVKEIEPDSVGMMPSIKKDSTAVNPDYHKSSKASVNCWHCSTAYDLRKRGYDVSAKPIESEFGSHNLDDFYECESKMSSETIKATNALELEAQRKINAAHYLGDDWFKTASKEVSNGNIIGFLGAEDDKGATTNIIPARAIASYAAKRSSIEDTSVTLTKATHDKTVYGAAMAESIENTINTYPNDSWGRIGLHWNNFQGGHSIIWEKDSSGKISFVDAQTNHKINIAQYAAGTEMYTSIQVQRTDNLQIKKSVLDYVTDHVDGEDNPVAYVDDTSDIYKETQKTGRTDEGKERSR